MDFTPTPEQHALRSMVRSVVKGYDLSVDPGRRRAVTREDPGYDPTLWKELGEAGVLGLGLPEDVGGGGAGPIEVGIVAEELGRVLAPEPFVLSSVWAAGLVHRAGSADQRRDILPAVASGTLVLTHAEAAVNEPAGVSTVSAEPVLHAASAGCVVWQLDGRLYLSDVPSGTSVRRTPDGARAGCVEVEQTALVPLGGGESATSTIAVARAHAQLAACHEAVGAMETALALVRTYLTERRQFGVTLNTFQSLTFRAADCYAALELTRSLVSWASMVADEAVDEEQVVIAAARAKLQTASASRQLAEEAIQLHGGIGMTAEHPIGHVAARLTSLGQWLGNARTESSMLGERVEGYGVLDPLR